MSASFALPYILVLLALFDFLRHLLRLKTAMNLRPHSTLRGALTLIRAPLLEAGNLVAQLAGPRRHQLGILAVHQAGERGDQDLAVGPVDSQVGTVSVRKSTTIRSARSW